MKNTASEDILQTAEEWIKQGRNIALATVVQTWGSSPRPAGSQLLVDQEGTFQGSVSGGCVETAVITEALEVIKSQSSKILEYGVDNELAWEVGLACGGKIKIFVEPVISNT
jgi:xanthine/CO dehydrogenase XdhC/CoxF family maturation factor